MRILGRMPQRLTETQGEKSALGPSSPARPTARSLKIQPAAGLYPGVAVRAESRGVNVPYSNEPENYELIIAASGQIVFDYDLHTGEIVWSGNLEQVLGYQPAEMGNIEEWADRIHPEDREEALRLLEVAEKDNATYDVEYRFRKKNGSYRWLHGRGFFLTKDDRSVRRMIGMMQDIHDQKQAGLLQNAVYRIAQAAETSAGLDELFKSVHGIIGTVMPAGNFYIAQYDDEKDLISFPYFVDEVDAQPTPVKPRKGLTEYVIRTGRPLLCDEATDMELRGRGEVEVVGAPSAIWLGVPLIVDGKTTGVMVVQHYSDPKAYGEAERRMLEFVSSQVARSIERKRAEEALRASEERFKNLFERSSDAQLLLDLKGKVVDCNTAFLRLFVIPSKAEVLGHSPEEFAPEFQAGGISSHERGNEVMRTVMEKGTGRFEWEHRKHDDARTPIHTELICTVISIAGQPMLHVAIRDITDRRHAEEALRKSEEKFSKAFRNSPIPLAITRLSDGKFLETNGAMEEIFGYHRDELIGRSTIDLGIWVNEDDRKRVVQSIAAEEAVREQEFLFRSKDGHIIVSQYSAEKIEIGEEKCLMSVIADITERKRAEESLRQGASKLRLTLKEAINSLSAAIEMRDPYTAGHQERVTKLAEAIGREMHLSDESIDALQVAGIVHDIGKLNVPAEILSKPTKLSDLEYAMIKMHVQVGYTILSKIDFPWPIADIVHQHHEAVNGSGYPEGLKEKDILIEARIIQVADVVEAMSSHRPYRPALGIQTALDQIAQQRGILYDREVVDACLSLFREKKFKFD